MQTKTYFASSVPAALEVARKELGADAMLVGSRPAPADVRAFGRLEVTFAFDPAPAAIPAVQTIPPQTLPSQPLQGSGYSTPSGRHSRSELDEIRQQIATLRNAVGGAVNAASAPAAFGDYLNDATAARVERDGACGEAVARLCSSGLDAETARDIVAAASRRPGDLKSAVIDEIAGRIRVRPFGPWKTGECRTIAFIGPPGRGKTTSLVKIAVGYGLAKRVPVRIYSAGAHSIGGQEQMARYAGILGVPFQAFESLASLHLALDGDTGKGLVLIDTPGLSRADSAEMRGFAGFFARRPEIEKHLVLRADARTADMIRMASCFSSLTPSRLLFTGLDEVSTPGALVELLVRSSIPAVFVGKGQQIPDDIEEPSAATWARAVGGENLPAAVAAA
jgi:flagellar biosynthesis protein FlhF